MKLFTLIEDTKVILNNKGRYSQTDLYHRNGFVYAKVGSSYIRLKVGSSYIRLMAQGGHVRPVDPGGRHGGEPSDQAGGAPAGVGGVTMENTPLDTAMGLWPYISGMVDAAAENVVEAKLSRGLNTAHGTHILDQAQACIVNGFPISDAAIIQIRARVGTYENDERARSPFYRGGGREIPGGATAHWWLVVYGPVLQRGAAALDRALEGGEEITPEDAMAVYLAQKIGDDFFRTAPGITSALVPLPERTAGPAAWIRWVLAAASALAAGGNL